MLYIFHVDTGRMLSFDMKLALESVQSLKETIERTHSLLASNLVLLISGGEILQSGSRVCSYSSGTDTNPIYMFSTAFSENKTPPQPWPSIEPDTDFKEQVRRCLDLPATYSTVVTRAQLAQQIHEMAKEEIRICEKLVYEQHLQQQGWAAVMANLEDVITEFRRRFEDFYRSFDQHLSQRIEYEDFLNYFNEDLNKLAKIPILPGLMQDAQQRFHGFDEIFDENESFNVSLTSRVNVAAATAAETSQLNVNAAATDAEPIELNADDLELSDQQKSRNLTLLQWISAKETHKTFLKMAENCRKGLRLFDEENMNVLKGNVDKTLLAAEQDDMKEIKGLKSRLEGLDKLMFTAKKKVQDQGELATAFQQNQTRASNLGDASILPDLCESHSSQLTVMLKNHLEIRDIRRRVSNAKEELGTNLMQRLKFVVQIENRMSDLDNQLLFNHRCLKRVQRHLVIIEQIHHAPSMYVTAVIEAVRRRTFSSAFLKWASELASELLTIHDEEVNRRQDFSSNFDGHFLNKLFAGMEDMPPTYAIHAPTIFDASLPNLTQNDLEVLSTYLPDITSKQTLPDNSAVINFFTLRSGKQQNQQEEQHDDVNRTSSTTDKNDFERPFRRPLDNLSHLRDGCESETDTEEFEKVGHSPLEQRQNSSTQPTTTEDEIVKYETTTISTSTDEIATKCAETLTEDNLGTTRLEVERLKALLKEMYDVSLSAISVLREQLRSIKTESSNDRAEVEDTFSKISIVWDKIRDQSETNEREAVNRLTVDHELELNDIKNILNSKNEEIDTLKSDKFNLELRLSDYDKTVGDLNARIAELERQVSSAAADRQKAVNEIKENLNREHKTEIESLRCRFKLMRNMERSPSDTSLEKIEHANVMDLLAHDSIIISSPKEDRPPRSQLRLSMSACSPTSTQQDMFKRIVDDKDRQLDVMREREKMLMDEITTYKETIQKLADSEGAAGREQQLSILRIQLDTLNEDKQKLEKELRVEKTKRVEMESSVTFERSLSTASTPKTKMQCPRFVCIEKFSRGDYVLIVWNHAHRQYTIVQRNLTDLYFLQAESHAALNLEIPVADSQNGGYPQRIYCFGRFVEKEYCYARKDENRYKVSKGTRFYRVYVRPVSPTRCDCDKCSPRRDRHDSERSQQSSVAVVASTTTSSTTASTKATVAANVTAKNLIDSFAQTEGTSIVTSLLAGASSSTSINRDMVDSGVVTQQKSTYKERNISISEDDETTILPYYGERCRGDVSVSEEDETCLDGGSQQQSQILADNNFYNILPILDETSSSMSDKDQDDSDEYRSLDAKDEYDFPY